MPSLKKVLTLSFAALIAQAILTKGLYPLLNLSTQTMFSINPVSGIGGTQFGDSILGYLSGYMSFDLANFGVWIAMFLGSFLLVYAGFFLYENLRKSMPWKDKNIYQRIFAILAYGHIVLFGLLWLLKMDVPGIAFNLLVGLGINLVGLSVIIGLAADRLKWPRV